MFLQLGFRKRSATDNGAVITQKDSQDRLDKPVRARHFLLERLAIDCDQNGTFLGTGGCHPGLIINKGKLAKQTTGLNRSQNDFFVFAQRLVDFDLAFLHDIGGIAGLAFAKNDLIDGKDLSVHDLLVAVSYAHVFAVPM